MSDRTKWIIIGIGVAVLMAGVTLAVYLTPPQLTELERIHRDAAVKVACEKSGGETFYSQALGHENELVCDLSTKGKK